MSNFLTVVSSLILQIRPEALQSVRDYLEQKDNLEVHASDEFSKLVIVVEMENDIELSDFMNEMSKVDGVITVNMVFHHTDSPEENESVITFKEAKHHA